MWQPLKWVSLPHKGFMSKIRPLSPLIMKQGFLVMITSSQISLVMKLACTFNEISMGLLLGLTFSHFACFVYTWSGLLTLVQMFVQWVCSNVGIVFMKIIGFSSQITLKNQIGSLQK